MMKRLLSIVAIALCGILTAFAEQLSVQGPIRASGGSAIVEIALNNERTNLVAFQMDLTLPDGISIDNVECTLSSRFTDENQELIIGKLESGTYRLISTSMALTPISGTGGALLTLRLTTTDGCVGGVAKISNIRFSTSDSERVTLDDVTFAINVLYTVTFKYGDEVLTTEEVEYGAVIPLLESLSSERYTLVEWLDVPESMPAHDITIQASYTDGVIYIHGNNPDAKYYQLNGCKIQNLKRGFNIIRMSDGTVRKVMVK